MTEKTINELDTLKARLFDTEEALKATDQSFRDSLAYLGKASKLDPTKEFESLQDLLDGIIEAFETSSKE